MSESLVILLHGVGSCGAHMLPLMEYLGRPSGMRVVAPDAPFAHDDNPSMRQWFSLQGNTQANIAARAMHARAAFDATITTALAGTGFTRKLDRVVFAGFSQGAIVALDALIRDRWPVAGVVSFAGMMVAADCPLPPAPRRSRVLMIHGADDPVIPLAAGRQAEALLVASGYEVGFRALAGSGHEITTAGLGMAGAFLSDVLRA